MLKTKADAKGGSGETPDPKQQKTSDKMETNEASKDEAKSQEEMVKDVWNAMKQMAAMSSAIEAIKQSTEQSKIAADMAASTADMALKATKDMKADMEKMHNFMNDEKKNRIEAMTTINTIIHNLQEQDKNIKQELERIKQHQTNPPGRNNTTTEQEREA